MRTNNKGVTMMLLVVTIILMIIIAFMAVYYSQNIAPEARVAAAYSSLRSIKDTCHGLELLYDSNRDEYYYFGRTIFDEYSIDDVYDYAYRCGMGYFEGQRVYVIDPYSSKDEDKRRIKNLELSNLNGIFIVDLDSDKFYLVDGVERIDGWGGQAYEFQDIQSMYDMLRSSERLNYGPERVE